MTKFYTNCTVYGSRILYRGVENGRRIKERVDYHPTLFLPSETPTEYTTLHKEYVSPIKPGNIREARDFINQYKDIQNFSVYGYTRYEYVYIADHSKDVIDWDRNHIVVANIDIEVGSENGFPEPGLAAEPITAITMKTGKKFVVFGCGEFKNVRSDVEYVKCRDEFDLIRQFLVEWTSDYPDAVTGWHIKFFDIPYLVNRITKLFGEKVAATLSPWGVINERKVFQHNKEQKAYILLGMAILDYIELYRKFAPDGNSQESYKLDYICSVEINEKKLSYEEHGSLHKLYRDDYQKFIEYNIRDVELVEKLDDKLKLIDLVLTLSYDNKCNYDDVFLQVRMWDCIIFNHFKKNKLVLPQTEHHDKDTAYIGAYVKDPNIGMHSWVASFDLTSLYPSLIRQYNISPDTIIEPETYTDAHREVLQQDISIDNMLSRKVKTDTLETISCSLTPNGHFFTTKFQGFLPKLMEEMFVQRVEYKKEASKAKKELEKESDPDKRYEIEKRISRYNNLQLIKKISLNSCYGALGSSYFRFFDIRQAIAITTAGQLAIKWIETKLNEYLNKVLNTINKDYVLASDTDSVYLCLDELVRQTYREKGMPDDIKSVISYMDKVCENMLQPFINKTYRDLAEYTNAFEQKMEMKREVLADRAIWTAKKRYIVNVYNNEGVEYAKPQIKVMGLEVKKSSTPTACRDKLWEVIDLILNKDEKSVQDFITQFRQDFKTLPVQDIAFPRGVNGISTYTDVKTKSFTKGTPIHVRGSIVYNQAIRKGKLDKKYPLITDGEKIKFIYLKEPNTIQSNIISFTQVLPKELDLDKYIDYTLQFDKSFLEPLKIILESIGWKAEKTSSLADFFT